MAGSWLVTTSLKRERAGGVRSLGDDHNATAINKGQQSHEKEGSREEHGRCFRDEATLLG